MMISSFQVKAQLTNVVYVGFNTPGSKVNRNFVFDLGLVKAKKAINFNMNTPWKTVGLSGKEKFKSYEKYFFL